MSIQTRFLLALAAVLVASVLGLSLAILTYTIPRLVQWETQEAHAQLTRAQRALEREFEHLLIYTREWSVWDDSYRFVQNPYPEYVVANLGAVNFAAADLDLRAYTGNDGQIVWAGFNAGGKVDHRLGISLAEEVWPHVQAASLRKAKAAGALITSQGPMVVAVYPILTSREVGPPRGMMITGRLMDTAFMENLRERAELDLEIASLSELAALTGPVDPPLQLAENGDPTMRVVSPAQLQVFTRFPDLVGRPSLVMRINLSRLLFIQAERIVRYSLMGAGAVFVIALLVAGVLLRRMVFVPIAALARHTHAIHGTGDYARRLNNPRRDEIGELAQEFDALLDRIGGQAEELKRQSFEDALTGLKNRRYFDGQLGSAWLMLQRSGQPLGLLILDVDEFKAYNDHYGHQQGDATLQAVARTLRHVVRRAVDTVARYGGEEFAAILPGTSAEDARILAERVREEVMALAIPHQKSWVATVVTVSIGAASAEAGAGTSAEELLRAADEALYVAKKSGKNTVFIAPDPCPDEAKMKLAQ